MQCVNCPAGDAVIQQLLAQYPTQLVAVAIHAGYLTYPFGFSQYDFRTVEAQSLYEQPAMSEGAVPAAAIDRVLFDGQSTVSLLFPTAWSGRIATQLEKTTPVNVYMAQQYNPANRQLDVYVQLRYTEAVTDENRLHLYLLESGMVDPQNIPPGETIDTVYVHRHVLRDMITPLEGVELTDETTAGRVIVKHFSYTLPQNFNADNCSLIAFVQEKTNGTILQGAEVDLGE